MTLTQNRLHELLIYEPLTGEFIWKVARRGKAKVGSCAGATKTGGYRQIMVDNCMYLAHRLAWLHVYGYFPTNELDHVNRCSGDNRIENLREVTKKQNRENVDIAKNNTSGRTAVFWAKASKKWTAKIGHNGMRIHLGYFVEKEEAVRAVQLAEAQYFTHRSAS